MFENQNTLKISIDSIHAANVPVICILISSVLKIAGCRNAPTPKTVAIKECTIPTITKIFEALIGNLKFPNQIKIINKIPMPIDNKASGKTTKTLTPKYTPKIDPTNTASTIRQTISFQNKARRPSRDENAKRGIKGMTTVIGKTVEPAASKRYTPPVAKAALTKAAKKLPKVMITNV